MNNRHIWAIERRVKNDLFERDQCELYRLPESNTRQSARCLINNLNGINKGKSGVIFRVWKYISEKDVDDI